MTRIAVIGGGISGLSAAFHVREIAGARGQSVDVTLFERSARLGGCIETQRDGAFILEMGSDSLATEKVGATQLAARLGLELQPIDENFRGTCIVRNGRLVRVPDEFRLFAPTSLRALVTSGLFSPAGILRAAIEPFVPARRTSQDESLAAFVTRRFGPEVLDRLAQPLLGGIYSGDPAKLSLRATMPQLVEIEQQHGSLVRGMRAVAKSAAKGPRLVSLRGGLGTLVDALERALHDDIRTNVAVTGLQRTPAGWDLTLSNGRHASAEAVICALPAYAAAELVRLLQPELARKLGAIVYHSIAIVTTVYQTKHLPELPLCTGFVVPASERRPIMATTFSTRKYAGRTPDGFTVLRAFVGGTVGEGLVSGDDESLVRIVEGQFRELLGIHAKPDSTIVRRWMNAMPEYAVGHRDHIEAIDRLAASLGGFTLTGSAYRGVGIADCIRNGETAATQTVSSVPSSAIAHGP